MYFSTEQIEQSLQNLEELNPFFGTVFLALKEIKLPENATMAISFLPLLEAFLQKYYRPTPQYDGFYTPFKTSNKKKRWNTHQYANTLHRIAVDTFSDVILHPKGSREWGWRQGYVDIMIENHLDKPIPTFDLAVWLFRTRDWPANTSPIQVIQTFFTEFQIQSEEENLFGITAQIHAVRWTQAKSIDVDELLNMIGYPPNMRSKPKRTQSQPRLFSNSMLAEYGATLQNLRLSEIGPAKEFELDFAPRINIITGDNALGKTFLLECAWWALTNTWASRYPAYPNVEANDPTIAFKIGKEGQNGKIQVAHYDRKVHNWSTFRQRNSLSGLSIFSQADGSFAIWDPAKIDSFSSQGDDSEAFLYADRQAVWDGVTGNIENRNIVRCRGLIEDWRTWSSTEPEVLEVFREVLKHLSPHPKHSLKPGEFIRVPELGVTPVPTLEFSYGSVPVILCSAGIKRIVALAYMLVWAWYEHVEQSSLIGETPQRSIVLIIDEMEAHLHPFWQRAIVPAIIAVVKKLSPEASTQIIIATHSPLVLASMEPIFNEDTDKLFHLKMDDDDGSIELNEEPFVKQGRIDRWLTSDIFGLEQPRSREAETAIKDANTIQLEKKPDPKAIQEISDRLKKVLAQDDEFWPLWAYFAKESGVKL
ncbi:hypothetical protein KDW_27980 [Dictyobacter vulcani]|uniref:ATPase AAA-type core domain-containing protein n=1 Tax=Dictyobacter vulcani TaxID=2607529 RepID=A0A5J4KTV8_9CHLR|nr:ATP-binding protein [Dictyobacter vulcani]GER88636.1 hypothetical protein KDW_27980 [Dictyobacter vulcani]